MKQVINIKNLRVNIVVPQHSASNKEAPSSSVDREVPPIQPGVYVLTEEGHLRTLEQFKSGTDKARGVAVVEGEHWFCIHPVGIEKELPMIDDDKECNLPKHETYRKAVADFNGYENTQELLRCGSPAAKCCKELGDEWYIPAGGELDLMDRHGDKVDEYLTAIGGKPIEKGWVYSATRYGNRSFFVLCWPSGIRDDIGQNFNFRVRPISAFSLLQYFNY